MCSNDWVDALWVCARDCAPRSSFAGSCCNMDDITECAPFAREADLSDLLPPCRSRQQTILTFGASPARLRRCRPTNLTQPVRTHTTVHLAIHPKLPRY